MKNLLGLDFGTKKIGLAVSIKGIISPLNTVDNNDQAFVDIVQICRQYQIGKIYIGLCQGSIALLTKKFIKKLKSQISLPIQTVEETASTIEADQIFLTNKNKRKDYKNKINSISAAVILRRVQI